MTCSHCGYNSPEGATVCAACGQPLTGAPGQGTPGATPSPGWLARNRRWAIPVGCLTALLLVALFVAGLFVTIFSMFRSSYVYQESLARARANLEVQQALGQPIEPGWFVSGNLNVSGASGEANLAIPISGPKGKGTIHLEAKKQAGRWEFQKLAVVVDGGAQIDLLASTRGPTSF